MRRRAPWAVVAVAALAYPLAVLADGGPSFPSRDDCVRPATGEGGIDAVFGYVDSQVEAESLRQEALVAGFQGTQTLRDGCGRVRVFLSGIPTLEVGSDFVDQARTVGFDVTLEQAS